MSSPDDNYNDEQEAANPDTAVEIPIPEILSSNIDDGDEENDAKVEFPVDLEFVDHFSLRTPSSTVRYRTKQVQVYDLVNDQLQLEHEVVNNDSKKPSLQVTMHRLRSGSIGLRFLRTIYSLVALLVLAFLLIFAAQVIAFQAMEIPKHSGQGANQELRIDVMIATILSLPLLGYSMASLMVLACAFVTDCWNGHVLFALLIPVSAHRNALVWVEWFSFTFYICVPVLALIISSFMGKADYFSMFALTWYICMNFSFFCFSALVLYHEIKICLDLTKTQNPELAGKDLIQKAILNTLLQSYCAVEEYTYLVQSDNDGHYNLRSATGMQPISTSVSLWSRIKNLEANPFYEQLETPTRRYALQERRESVPYVTRQAWSLERMCCKVRNGRSRFVVSGPSALDPRQYKSTLGCNFMGFLLATLAICALAYGMGQGLAILLVLAIGIMLLVGLPLLRSAQQLARAMPQEASSNEPDAPAFYQAWAAFTVAKPKEWYCWMRMGISFVLFFAWPTVSLYASGLYKAATLFLATSLFSGVRLYLDAGSQICERGTLSHIQLHEEDEKENDNNNNSMTEEEKYAQKAKFTREHARAAEIMGKVTSNPRILLWYALFVGLGIYVIYSGATSLNGETAEAQTGRETIVLVDGFYYPPQPDISYTTCELHKAYEIPGQNVTYTMDYNFLAGIAYETSNVTEYVMEKWFGPNEWIDEKEFVHQWKLDHGYENSPVSFKLFSKVNSPGTGILAIRGTETPTDRLFNMLLYASSFLVHFARVLMPFSDLWNDIYDELVATTSWVASQQLQEIAYYRETTHFANSLLKEGYTFEGKSYNWLRTTGVSLGGGLALITGAQSDAFGLAIAGMNPVDARRSFHPPLQMDALNTQVLNIIPENDFISSMGTKVRNFETVGCRTWPAERVNCHSFWRIFCEYTYSCGTPPGKPAYCICVKVWGYPEPLPVEGTNITFSEACDAEDAEFRNVTGGGD